MFEHSDRADADWRNSERQSQIPESAHSLNVKGWTLFLVDLKPHFSLVVHLLFNYSLLFLSSELNLCFAEIKKKKEKRSLNIIVL